MNECLTYTVEEAGRLLGVGRATAYSGVRSGDIPSLRIGRRVVVPKHALLSLLNADDPAGNGISGKTPAAARPDGS
jgi:excisionase family DNA binding protein